MSSKKGGVVGNLFAPIFVFGQLLRGTFIRPPMSAVLPGAESAKKPLRGM